MIRIGIGGMSIESSAFSAHRSGFDDFRFTYGTELLDRHIYLAEGSDFIKEFAGEVEFVPLAHARALPGGVVKPEVYEKLTEELLGKIAEVGYLDGLLFDIHGAMSVENLDDAEGVLAKKVREALNKNVEATQKPRTLMAAPMDLHGNVSYKLAENVDILSCYRTAPHIDVQETRERTMRNLIRAIQNDHQAPYQALVHVPVLLPGEKTSTRLEPAKGIYEQIEEICADDDILDSSVWVGYAWADEPRCKTAVLTVSYDKEKAERASQTLAKRWWDARDEFEFVAPTADLQTCLDLALEENAPRPYVISDSGDNPTAGGSGDVTYALNMVLKDERYTKHTSPKTFITSIFDKDAVEKAHALGLGAKIDIVAGAKVDKTAPPAHIGGEVAVLTEGSRNTGKTATIKVGGLYVVITSKRAPFHNQAQYDDVGLNMRDADILINKIGYLEPELFELANGWTMALTPGGVDQDLVRLGHERIDRPMVPFDQVDDTPELETIFFKDGKRL